MHYIKVLATDSTNTELKRRLARNPRMSDTSFFAQNQKQGRGQRGTQWFSDSSKNLTFSILLNNLNLPAQDNFKLNAGVSLSICQFLKTHSPHLNFYIKWPNDILAEDLKLCGILIENFLQGQQIKSSIIGIGLNTNQVNFDKLPKATSLRNLTHRTFNLEQLWRELTESIEKNWSLSWQCLLMKFVNATRCSSTEKVSKANLNFPMAPVKREPSSVFLPLESYRYSSQHS